MLRVRFSHGKFRPPATELQILAAESALGVRLPAQLRRLYFECDGFREDKGNARYLLSLLDDDFGSLVTFTRFFWTEWERPNLRPFVIFGFSGGDEAWGIDQATGTRIVAYHHHMGETYEAIATDILGTYLEDYAKYDNVGT